MSVVAQHSVRNSLGAQIVSRRGWRKVALACGAASTLLYFGMDVLASLLYDGYSYTDQTISELSAVGAPTRPLWIPLGLLYSVLVIAGGLGIWASAGGRLSLRSAGGLVAAVGILGLVAWPFAPMHQREVLAAGGGTLSDTLHIILAMADTFLFLLIIAFGAAASGKQLRLFAVATMVVVLVFGALTGMDSPRVESNEPTPWLGVKERIAVFGSMLWISLLAISLWRVESRRSLAEGGQS